jgi:tRNA (guanine10-N2)-methyltransferase
MAAEEATAAAEASLLDASRCHVLIEFAYKHLDFQMAEVESVLEMNGLARSVDYSILPLSNNKQPNINNNKRPFCILSLPTNSSTRFNKTSAVESVSFMLLSRCTLVRSVMELWGYADTLESCAASVQQWMASPIGQSVHESFGEKSWKLTIHTLGCKYSREEQEQMRGAFAFLGFKGEVKMKDPDNEFIFIREEELDANGGALHSRKTEDAPLACYFGRAMHERKVRGRGDVHKYNLANRSYLGPTSMDAELAFIMTNLAQVGPHKTVLDPFVGTGSILLSCALRGAYCIGTDIDLRVLRGTSDDENIVSNFRQFSLQRPELIRSDNSIYHKHYREHAPLYDAIVCDPPYGIRAGARKSGSRQENPRPIRNEYRHDHIAQTQ